MCSDLLLFWPGKLPSVCGQEADVRTILKKVQPQYPTLAERMNIQGVVKLEVTVEPNGTVKSINAGGGHPLLVQAAQQAIRLWNWQPAAHETVEAIEIRFDPD